MSAGMIGADPEALRAMALRFDDAAEQLAGVRSGVQPWVNMTHIWRGLDHGRFKDMWDTDSARVLLDAASTLSRYADLLRTNAEEQDGASAGDGAPNSGSGLFGKSEKDPASPARDLKDFEKAFKVPRAVLDYVLKTARTIDATAGLARAYNLRLAKHLINSGNLLDGLRALDATADFSAFRYAMKSPLKALGVAAGVPEVVMAINQYFATDDPEAKQMAMVHGAKGVISMLGPVGAAGALAITGFEAVMPTTDEKKDAVMNYGLRQMYPGVAVKDLTPEQFGAIGDRYDGLPGFGNFVTDTVGYNREKATKAASGLFDAGKKAVETISVPVPMLKWKAELFR